MSPSLFGMVEALGVVMALVAKIMVVVVAVAIVTVLGGRNGGVSMVIVMVAEIAVLPS